MNRSPVICIINRNYPPLPGATGYHAHQLATYLINQGMSVHIVTTAPKHARIESPHRHYIQPYYKGTMKVCRLLSAYLEARHLILRAKRIEAAYYIVMTDPPLLNYFASKHFKTKKWILWSMDIFPDGFVANGLVSLRSPLYNWYRGRLYRHPPDLLISLGKGQAAYLNKNYYPMLGAIIWPIGIMKTDDGSGTDARVNNAPWNDSNRVKIAYIGNLGEAHDPSFLIQLAALMDPDKYCLILSCQGTHTERLYQELADREQVYIVSALSYEEMQAIDIHVVILREEWTHICVPSKAITAIEHGGAVLFCGSCDSDTWHHVGSCGWNIANIAELQYWFSNLNLSDLQAKRSSALPLYERLKDQKKKGWQRLATFLLSHSMP